MAYFAHETVFKLRKNVPTVSSNRGANNDLLWQRINFFRNNAAISNSYLDGETVRQDPFDFVFSRKRYLKIFRQERFALWGGHEDEKIRID